MSSRIELTLAPSAAAGMLSVIPWLVLAAFLLAAAAAGTLWSLAGVPVVCAGAAIQYRRSGLLRGASLVDSLVLEEGQLFVGLTDKRRIAVTLGTNSRMGARLALLKLHPVGTRFSSYSAMLLADTVGVQGNVPTDEFRRLRMWLRLGRSQPASR